jgi:hypothetical protein
MEQRLGFKLEASMDSPKSVERWYSDLSPVCCDLRERMEKEYEAWARGQRGAQEKNIDITESLPEPGESLVGIYFWLDQGSIF